MDSPSSRAGSCTPPPRSSPSVVAGTAPSPAADFCTLPPRSSPSVVAGTTPSPSPPLRPNKKRAFYMATLLLHVPSPVGLFTPRRRSLPSVVVGTAPSPSLPLPPNKKRVNFLLQSIEEITEIYMKEKRKRQRNPISSSSGVSVATTHTPSQFSGHGEPILPNKPDEGSVKRRNEKKRIWEELEQLERMEKASTSCKEMFSNVETRPDPLLPLTIGPLNPLWDRWFEGPPLPQDSKGWRC
ncbi:uncharacterized protein LOC133302997 [Gastrolobium bilobum]|uniref:uncharacterized protein LOC133302997 n=1 Tax=Gastrolobium bilobum TaxID=150636 RepID=UPI002AB1AC61|nr:uncharacterized protein LOC133302997 [Gastrolobium bilobum]